MFSRRTVLVADDSPTVRRFLVELLKGPLNCADVREAADGQEALKLLRSGVMVDWIFSDWEMPGMGGDVLLYEVRRDPATSAVPFIMITSRNDRDSLITAAQAGVTDYLIKPFTAASFVDKIRRINAAIERRAARRLFAEGGIRAILSRKGKEVHRGVVVNLSEGGALLRCATQPQSCLCVYELFAFSIELDDGSPPVEAMGELRRIEADPDSDAQGRYLRAGFRFTVLEGKHRKRLAAYLEGLDREVPPDAMIE